jgi:hypothetical protein
MNVTKSCIKTDKLILEYLTKNQPRIQQNITSYKSFTENCYDDNQQKPSVIYKYIEKYKVQLLDDVIPTELYIKLYSALLWTEDSNEIINILMQNTIILTKFLCNSRYDNIIKDIIIRNKTKSIDTLLYCIFTQNKIDLISDSLKEMFFIYACQHPDKCYSNAVINLYKATAYFFEPSYIQTIHDLYLNKDITVAINADISIEDSISSKNLFKARYCPKQKDIFKSIDYLDLDMLSLMSKTEDIFGSTTAFIKNLKNIAIYLTSEHFPIEENNFYTFGDENSCLNILNQLISLGIKEATIYVSPPDRSSITSRKKCSSFYKRYQYQNTKSYVIRKLSLLLTSINSELGLPQCIIKDGCTINIRFIDEVSPNNETSQEKIRSFIETTIGIKYPSEHEELRASTIKENLVFIFYQDEFSRNTKNLSNLINILPFSWCMEKEKIIFPNTDIKPESKIDCKNPSYSILREQETNLPLKYIGINAYENWLFDLLTTVKSNNEATTLSTIINLIAANIKNKTIQHGTIYGLHHYYVKENAETILSSWINSSNELSIEVKQPIILSVISNTLAINKQQFNNENTLVIDLSQSEDKNDYLDQINYCLKNNKTIVLFFPSLPKPVFHYLIDNTTMPILVEGANTTSYALQTGKPYLSVLPSGATEIPTKMGDPWIAFLQKLLSYKLESSKEFLNHF